jgi:hypothetical protein
MVRIFKPFNFSTALLALYGGRELKMYVDVIDDGNFGPSGNL